MVRGRGTTRCRALAAFVALSLAWGACPDQLAAQSTARPQRVEDPFRRFRDADPQPIPLLPSEIAWTLTLPTTPSAGGALGALHVYVPLRDGRLIAVDRESGLLSWTRIVNTSTAPVVDATTVYTLHGASLRALDAATGEDRWAVVMDAPPIAPLRLVNGLLLAVIEPGEAFAFRASTGELLWRRPLGAPAVSAPVGGNGALYVTVSDGRLLALAPDDGRILWEQKVPGALSEPAVADDRVYVGSTDNGLYAFDADGGVREWRYPGGGDVIGAVADAGLVYVVSLDNIIRALNRGNGNQRWKKEAGTRPTLPPMAFGGLVIVPGLLPAATIFNGRTGALLGTLAVAQGNLMGPPLIDTALTPYRVAIVTLTREGVLEAHRPTTLMFREPVVPVVLPALPGRALPRETLR